MPRWFRKSPGLASALLGTTPTRANMHKAPCPPQQHGLLRARGGEGSHYHPEDLAVFFRCLLRKQEYVLRGRWEFQSSGDVQTPLRNMPAVMKRWRAFLPVNWVAKTVDFNSAGFIPHWLRGFDMPAAESSQPFGFPLETSLCGTCQAWIGLDMRGDPSRRGPGNRNRQALGTRQEA